MTISEGTSQPEFRQWDIWQAEWEHEDGTSKDRPVLILSNGIGDDGKVWVAKFTKTEIPGAQRILFETSDASFSQTGLQQSCYLYPAQARKLRVDQFRCRRGKMSQLGSAGLAYLIKQILKFDL
jgi:hypothetical protein